MPTLDVTEILSDPDFAEEIDIERRTDTVNSFGVTSASIEHHHAVGVVTAGKASLEREIDQQHMTKDIVVHTTFRLRGPTRGFQPDVVIWNGNRYVVRDMKDWSQFGAGYIRAECESMSHLDHPDRPADEDDE